MVKIFTILAVSAIGFFTNSFAAEGDMIPCPQPKVGSSFEYSIKNFGTTKTEMFTIMKVDNGGIETTLNGESVRQFDKNLNPIKFWSNSILDTKYPMMPECPFAFGATNTYSDIRYKAPSGAEVNAKFTVNADHKLTAIKTLAGEFSVIKITVDSTFLFSGSRGSGFGQSRTISYYSPDLGMLVKSDYSVATTGERNSVTRELVSIKKE